jgi:hypothetical protein
MFFGDTAGQGQANLLWEVVSNSLDQVLQRQASQIWVSVDAGARLTVRDDGPGLPLQGVDDLVSIVTEPHATPTRDGHSPHVHVRRHGVGLAAVAAAAGRFHIVSEHGGRRWSVLLEQGRVVHASELDPLGSAGTIVTWHADPELFEGPLPHTTIHWRLFALAALTPGLTVHLGDQVLQGDLGSLLPGGHAGGPYALREGHTDAGHRLRLAIRHGLVTGVESTLLAYVNLSPVRSAGSLHQALRAGLERDRWPPVQGAVVADLWHPSVRYAGPSRDALDQPDLVEPIAELVTELVRDLQG